MNNDRELVARIHQTFALMDEFKYTLAKSMEKGLHKQYEDYDEFLSESLKLFLLARKTKVKSSTESISVN